jgi:hypothetical protein
MNSTITYHIDTKAEVFRDFNRFSKFVLVGNSFGGYVNVQLRTFDCFEEVIKSLPRIINDLAFYGKWDICLYQVPTHFRLIEKPKHYKIPDKGKMIFKLDHLIATSFMNIFVTFSVIHLALCDKKISSQTKSSKTDFDIRLTETYITIQLDEPFLQKPINLNQFHGDTDKLFDSHRY